MFGPGESQNRGFWLDSGRKTTRWDAICSPVQVCRFWIYLVILDGTKSSLSHHSVGQNHRSSRKRNLMPKGATSVARRQRTASKGPVGRKKTGVSCDTVASLVKTCIFSALARHLFWHSKKAPFFDPQGRPKERVLLGSGSTIENLVLVFSFMKVLYFCVFF